MRRGLCLDANIRTALGCRVMKALALLTDQPIIILSLQSFRTTLVNDPQLCILSSCCKDFCL